MTLECRDLSKVFGGVRAVDNVSLAFEEGRVTALIGPNGAGKTTLFHLLAGALRPDSGEIFYRGRRINGLRSWQFARLGIGRLFQDVRVFGRLTARENILLALSGSDGCDRLALPAKVPSGRLLRGQADEVSQYWLEQFGLASHADSPAEVLSYGQQKLLAMARLLAAGADVLLLDEPTAGTSMWWTNHLLSVIRQLASEGKTMILIEHNLTAVLGAADWAYFMDEGQVVAFGLPDEVLGDPEVRTAFTGLGGGR